MMKCGFYFFIITRSYCSFYETWFCLSRFYTAVDWDVRQRFVNSHSLNGPIPDVVCQLRLALESFDLRRGIIYGCCASGVFFLCSKLLLGVCVHNVPLF